MTVDDMERRLQDYLDGRLSTDDAGRLEASLRENPELAARLRAAREVREALGAGDEVLSPGFYTRARREFEERSTAASPRGFRWLSWEAVGLAGAAMLALVVFGPYFNRMDTPPGPGTASRELQAERAKTEAPTASGAGERSDAAGLSGAAENFRDAAEQAPEETKRQVVSANKDEAETSLTALGKLKEDLDVADAAAPPSVSRRASVPAPQSAPAVTEQLVDTPVAPPAQAEPTRAQKGRTRPAPTDDAEGDGFAPEPPTFAGEAVSNESDALGGRAAVEAPERAREYRMEPAANVEDQAKSAMEKKAKKAGVRLVLATELPRGMVDAGSLRVIDDPVEIDRLTSDAGLTRDATHRGETRVVLVGARDDLRCDTLAVEMEGAQWVLSFTPLPGQGSPGGCKLTVPRDGRAVTLRDQRSATP